MHARTLLSVEPIALGIGYYTVPEAARLTKIPARNINRWLGGYSYSSRASSASMPPLWLPQLPRAEDHIELGFRDLIELRFINAFLDKGLKLQSIRQYLVYARECIGDERPFSTRRFQTDGKSIYLETIDRAGEAEMLDLKRHQYVLKQVIEQSFKDLDIEDDAVVRWRPFQGKSSIVIDPARSFGQPIFDEYGVPTVVLSDAVRAEGSVERVASIFEVPVEIVRESERFERYLLAA